MKWRVQAILDTRHWRAMRDQLANDLTHQNEIAAGMINDTLPGVYAENHNYGTFSIERESGLDTSYTLYSRDTVKELLQDNKQLLPRPRVNIPKDQQWNARHIQSEALQGILQGESMDGIADRLRNVTDMSARAAIRNARTAVTGAENAGRLDSMERAEKMGIKMKQVWMATLDDRTRDSHRRLDGEQIEVGEKFSNGLRYPGDPLGDPSEVYNCRCTMAAVVAGSDPYRADDLSARPSAYLRDSGMTYEEWKAGHEPERGKSSDFINSEVGKPVLEKDIDFSDKKAIFAELQKVQLEADDLDYEINCSITVDGKVWMVKGEGSSVNPSSIPSDLRGSYSYHNHPTERTNYSFSAPDVGFFLSSGEQYSEASDKLFKYSMERTADTPDIDYDVAFHKFKEFYGEQVMMMAWQEGLDIERDGYHETMKLLSKEYNFIYKRTKRK